MTDNSKINKRSPKSRAGTSWGRESDWQFIADKLKDINTDSVEEFYINNNIPKKTFYDAIKKYPCMEEAFSIANDRLGIKNEKLCKERNLGMNTVTARLLPQYLDRWKKDIEWHGRLKEELQGANSEELKEILEEVLKKF